MEYKSVFEFACEDSQGIARELAEYQGKVTLIVNTASKCGFTPQYEDLENLQKSYKDSGFSILAFPCNQFGSQEPGSDSEIVEFCSTNYGVTFPIFKKIEVNGKNGHPLYKFLKASKKGIFGSSNIKWNFTKFLINKEGSVVKRYGPNINPKKIEKDIKLLLKSS